MKLAVCAICRNEKDYLAEWISFQKAIGFDKVFIYDNVSDDGTSEILASLHEAGAIERIHWPRRANVVPQREAYAHFLQTHAMAFEWVLICDLDEFMMPAEGNVRDLIAAAINANPEVSAIAIPWLMFGSGGHETVEPGLVLQRFTKCDPTPAQSVKTLFRPKHAYNMRTHICDLTTGDYVDNTFAKPDWSSNTPIDLRSPVFGKVVMHHYFTKSREEWIRRRSARRANRVDNKTYDLKKFDLFHSQQAENASAFRFLPEVAAAKADLDLMLRNNDQAFEGQTTSILAMSGSWLIGRTTGIALGTRIRVVINDQQEVITTNSMVLTPGSFGFVVNLRWMGTKVEKVRISAIGALAAVTLTPGDLPPAAHMLEDAIRYMPGAEQLIFDLFVAASSTRQGLRAIRSFPMPQFMKFVEIGDFIRAVQELEDKPDTLIGFMDGFMHRYGKVGATVLSRFKSADHYVGKLLNRTSE